MISGSRDQSKKRAAGRGSVMYGKVVKGSRQTRGGLSRQWIKGGLGTAAGPGRGDTKLGKKV